jgi:hypothetical protein
MPRNGTSVRRASVSMENPAKLLTILKHSSRPKEAFASCEFHLPNNWPRRHSATCGCTSKTARGSLNDGKSNSPRKQFPPRMDRHSG